MVPKSSRDPTREKITSAHSQTDGQKDGQKDGQTQRQMRSQTCKRARAWKWKSFCTTPQLAGAAGLCFPHLCAVTNLLGEWNAEFNEPFKTKTRAAQRRSAPTCATGKDKPL